MAGQLSPENVPAALASISAWQRDPEVAVACPICRASGLSIIDRSARPFAEWYVLRCDACGLDHTLHIPLAPPPSSE